MRPLFIIHAGELLTGEYIERNFRNTHVWIPAKDIGIDLLVTDKKNEITLSLQVKFSRDFLVTDLPAAFQRNLQACGWWTFNREKLKSSSADYWVLVLTGFAHRTNDYIIIPPKELLRRLEKLHANEVRLQSYLWVTKSKQCWETRGLRRSDQLRIVNGKFKNTARDFSKLLNNWEPIERLNNK
jgi:hypothetical protein